MRRDQTLDAEAADHGSSVGQGCGLPFRRCRRAGRQVGGGQERRLETESARAERAVGKSGSRQQAAGHDPRGRAAVEPDRSGRLHGAARVYVADSASFSNLSAKNMSLGMMANAMRIAAEAAA